MSNISGRTTPKPPEGPGWKRVHKSHSSLLVRILAVNALAIMILAIGIFYIDEYRENLIRAELELLKTEIDLVAIALGESTRARDSGRLTLSREHADGIIDKMSQTLRRHAMVFDARGRRIVDRPAPPRDELRLSERRSGSLDVLFDRFLESIPIEYHLPPDPVSLADAASGTAGHFPDVDKAIEGKVSLSVWKGPNEGILLSVASPVIIDGRLAGAVLLLKDDTEIEIASAHVRSSVLRLFIAAFSITVFLSVYLSATIGRPLRRLALAAENVRRGRGRHTEIPDFSARGDEIGELSLALREMTGALSARMDMIERFAADVAHELKNPLTSMRSAVETVMNIDDPEKRQRLYGIVIEDIGRMNHLISEISRASRIDAEISRDVMMRVDMDRLLADIVEGYRLPGERGPDERAGDSPNTAGKTIQVDSEGRRLGLTLAGKGPFPAYGNAQRLAHVFRNVITNAISFTPPGGLVKITLENIRQYVAVTVDDEGPGIAETDPERIFERFYTSRGHEEPFGQHAGLGLSIARQIVNAHSGEIRAENRTDPDGNILGARFLIFLRRL